MRKSGLIVLGAAVVLTGAWLGFRQAQTADYDAKMTAAAAFSEGSPSGAVMAVPPPPVAEPAPTTLPSTLSSAEDISERCMAVFAIGNATDRKAAFEKLLASITDIEGLSAIVETMTNLFERGRRFDSEWDSLWRTIAHRDPKTAITLIESFGSAEKWYANAVGKVAHEWASKDPLAAMRWLEDNQALTDDELDFAALNLLYGYASRDLKAATAYALSVFNVDDPLFADVSFTLTRNALQQGGVDGLLAWFRALPDGPAKQKIFQSVGSRLGEVGREVKRAWLDAEAHSSYRNDQTYREFVRTWAETDPRGAMDYAFNLPPSPHQPSVTVGVGYASFAWLVQDPAGFARYFHSVPPGPRRISIVKALKDGLGDPNLPMKKRKPATQFLESLQ